jgi:hypothetical protein
MAYDPLGGAPSGDQAGTFANNLSLLGYNQNQADVAGPLGNAEAGAAATNLGTVSNYDNSILSGNRTTVLSAEAPEIGSILSGYDTARKASAELAPRGGGRSASLNELPYKEAGDVNKQIEKARPQAAQQLTQVAGEQAGLGTAEQGIAASDVNSSLDFLLGKAGAQLDWANLDIAQGQQIGQLAAQLVSNW